MIDQSVDKAANNFVDNSTNKKGDTFNGKDIKIEKAEQKEKGKFLTKIFESNLSKILAIICLIIILLLILIWVIGPVELKTLIFDIVKKIP